jgi:hypothetical protein
MTPLRSEYLGRLTIEVAQSHMVGAVPRGRLRVDVFGGGSFEGPRIKAKLLSGGADALVERNDRAMQPDVRLTLETDDGALIFVSYRGVRHGSPEAMAAIARGETPDPSSYYLRNAPFFETAAPKYDWLNRIVAVGVGRRTPTQAIYEVHEIL